MIAFYSGGLPAKLNRRNRQPIFAPARGAVAEFAAGFVAETPGPLKTAPVKYACGARRLINRGELRLSGTRFPAYFKR